MVPRTAGHVLCDMGVNEPRASRLEVHIGVANIRFSFAERLYLGSVQYDPRFHPLQKGVVVGGGTVLGDDLFARLIRRARSFFGKAWPQFLIVASDEKTVT